MHRITTNPLSLGKLPKIDTYPCLSFFYSSFVSLPSFRSIYRYLQGLLGYLTSFYRRGRPLVDVDKILKEADAEFEKFWLAEGTFLWSRYEDRERQLQTIANGDSEASI